MIRSVDGINGHLVRIRHLVFIIHDSHSPFTIHHSPFIISSPFHVQEITDGFPVGFQTGVAATPPPYLRSSCAAPMIVDMSPAAPPPKAPLLEEEGCHRFGDGVVRLFTIHHSSFIDFYPVGSLRENNHFESTRP
jgi:hypothetical protein